MRDASLNQTHLELHSWFWKVGFGPHHQKTRELEEEVSFRSVMAAISYPVAFFSSGACCSCSSRGGSSLNSAMASSSAGRHHVGRETLRWVLLSHMRRGAEDLTRQWRNAGPGQWACKALHAGDKFSEDENPFDLEKEFRKALASEESQVICVSTLMCSWMNCKVYFKVREVRAGRILNFLLVSGAIFSLV